MQLVNKRSLTWRSHSASSCRVPIPGQSDVLATRKEPDLLRGAPTFDNDGAWSTGRNRLVFEVQPDHPPSLNNAEHECHWVQRNRAVGA